MLKRSDSGTYQKELISIKRTLQNNNYIAIIPSASAGRNRRVQEEDQKTTCRVNPNTEVIKIKNCVYTIPYSFGKDQTSWLLEIRLEEQHKVTIRGKTMKSDMEDHVWKETHGHQPPVE